MTRLICLYCLVLGLLLLGCAGQAGPTAVPLPTQAAVAQVTATATPVSSATPQPSETAVAIQSSTPAPTQSSTPTPTPSHTPVPTDTPIPTPTLVLSPPPGVIYFFWDPRPVPSITSAGMDPILNLYQAKFSSLTREWVIQPILEELISVSSVALSSDETRLAFTTIEDSNGDGQASGFTQSLGQDFYRLYIYDLEQDHLDRVPFSPPHNLFVHSWLTDSQTLLFSARDLYLWNTATEQALDIPQFTYPPTLRAANLSPDGRFTAFDTSDDSFVKIVDIESGEIIQLVDEKGDIFAWNRFWSPDSRWLALYRVPDSTLILIETENKSNFEFSLPENVQVVGWSPDSEQLLLSSKRETAGRLYVFSLQEKQLETVFETEIQITGRPTWTPDSQSVLFSLYSAGTATFTELDLATRDVQSIWNYMDLEYPNGFFFQAWSPDENWGVFTISTASLEEGANFEINTFHLESKQVFTLKSGQNAPPPSNFFWVS